MFQRFTFLLLSLLLGNVCAGQTWTSADLRVVVAEPDPAEFKKVEPPPSPFTAFWTNADKSVSFSVMQLPIPPGTHVDRRDIVAGFGQELGGEAKELDLRTTNGFVIAPMVVTTATQEVRQAVFFDQKNMYKAMAVCPLEGDKSAVDKFINSFEVKAPTRPDVMPPKTLDTNQISKFLGAGGVIILIIALAANSMRKKKSK